MARNPDAPEPDSHLAARQREAQHRLADLAGDEVPPRPWRPAPVPPSAVDLTQFATAHAADLQTDDLLAALALLPAARAEIDGLEAALLFTARGAGLTWAQIAEAMGFNSPQACQQHFTRLAARQDSGA